MAKIKDSEDYFVIYHGEVANEFSDIQDAISWIEKDINSEDIEIDDIQLIKGRCIKLKSRIKVSVE
jgi:hypothetical protein